MVRLWKRASLACARLYFCKAWLAGLAVNTIPPAIKPNPPRTPTLAVCRKAIALVLALS